MAEAGETIDRARALEMEDAGVREAFVTVEEHGEEREVKIITNGMVDIKKYVPFDVAELGIHERVDAEVLFALLDEHKDEEELKEAIRAHARELVPNYITKKDILSSVNYIFTLDYDIGNMEATDNHQVNMEVGRARGGSSLIRRSSRKTRKPICSASRETTPSF